MFAINVEINQFQGTGSSRGGLKERTDFMKILESFGNRKHDEHPACSRSDWKI